MATRGRMLTKVGHHGASLNTTSSSLRLERTVLNWKIWDWRREKRWCQACNIIELSWTIYEYHWSWIWSRWRIMISWSTTWGSLRLNINNCTVKWEWQRENRKSIMSRRLLYYTVQWGWKGVAFIVKQRCQKEKVWCRGRNIIVI